VFVSLTVQWKPILLVYPLTCGGDVTTGLGLVTCLVGYWVMRWVG
jgi:hypothetical protein